MVYEITLCIEICLLMLCLHDFYGKKLKPGIKELVATVAQFMLMEGISKGLFSDYLSLFCYLILFVYGLIAFKQGIVKLIVNFFLTIMTMVILQAVAAFLVMLFLQDTAYNGVAVLLIYIIMFGLYGIIRKLVPLSRIADILGRRNVIINFLFVMCVGIILVELAIVKFQRVYYGDYIIAALLICLVIVLAINWTRYKEKALQAEAQLQAYETYGKTFEKLISDMRMKQHDFKDHINAIYSQHHMYDNYEDLVANQRRYCANLLDDNKYYDLLRLNNAVLAGYLYGKFLELEDKGIVISYNITVESLNVHIPEYKLVEIFSNLINNAVDELKHQENKHLNVCIKEFQDKYSIIISNVGNIIEPEQLKQMFRKNYSNKGAGRGLGLYILSTMSKEYGFSIMCENELIETENWVTFKVEISKESV